ncbi:MAG: hypothetical protein CML05_21150 [Pseudozobellia sp.]|jgi:hypothetical protein|nr:hypothetical protein [Pseudozobellia sp.]|tara:strand:- start:10326 stop:11858 length:1533 start_codon:yes stop_codon:yes gene_type:complete
MTPRIIGLDQRYAASASLVRHGVEIITVRDERGGRFDLATRSLFRLIQRDGPGVWDHLAGAAKALRSHLVTDPMPIERNAQLTAAAGEVGRQARQLFGAVDEDALLREIADAAAALCTRDPLVGTVLRESLTEVGPESAVVVAASSRSREALGEWLGSFGARVLTLDELERVDVSEDIAYFVGPPRFFKSAAVTAPRTLEVTFILPAWFGDRTVPRSAIAQYAEGGIHVAARIVEAGDALPALPEPATSETEPIPEDDLLPQPVWGSRVSEDRAPNADEVEARKVLLSGNRAIWLDDDGERIRALDPTQPPGERVGYSDVSVVAPGTYLLLREGEAERESLHARAFGRIGPRASVIQESQASWKSALIERLRGRGARDSESALRALGVRAAGQVRAWTSPHVIRPQSDGDFERLLGWLGLPVQPHFGFASLLRHEVHRATRELRDRLEAAADVADLHELERVGHMTLDIAEPGFRGMFVTRVLAIAPFTELIARHDARVPFADEGAQWLE